MRDPPNTLWLPAEDSNGTCYHIKRCGAHRLEEVPFDEAVGRIRRDGLRPCTACVEHHGLNVYFDQ